MIYFFYGTLRDADIRKLVLGDSLSERTQGPLHLKDHRLVYVKGQPYPTITPAPGHTCEGELFGPLFPSEIAQLSAYEGDEYKVISLSQEQVLFHTFILADRSLLTKTPWNFAAFQSREKAFFLSQLRDEFSS